MTMETVDRLDIKHADDATARLWWGVRSYWWLVAMSLVLGVGLAFGVGRTGENSRVYRASALIITQRLSIESTQFPSLAEAIFTSGTVANGAVVNGKLPYDPSDLIPTHAQIEPIEDSGALYVIGRDRNPELAVETANAAAEALEKELNQTGELGTFSLQSNALPELVTEEERLALPILVLMGGVAGLLNALGLIGVILLVRRPVLNASDAAELAGATPLIVLNFPRVTDDAPMKPQFVGGLSSLASWLFPEGRGVGVLVSCEGSESERTHVALLLSQVMARSSRVVLVRSHDPAVQEIYSRMPRQRHISVSDDVPGARPGTGKAVVIDGPTTRDQDVPQHIPPTASTLLVVKEGTPGRAVEVAGGQFLPGDSVGVVCVRSGGIFGPRTRLRGIFGPRTKEEDRSETEGPAGTPYGESGVSLELEIADRK